MNKEDKTEEIEKKRQSVCWNLKEVNKELNPKKTEEERKERKKKNFVIKFHEEVERTIYYDCVIDAETEEEAKEIFNTNPWDNNYDETDSWDKNSSGAEIDSIEEEASN